MKLLNFMVICMVALIILSCAKKEVKTYEQSIVNGIKITESSTTPADSTFKIVLKEVAEISNDDDEHPENCFNQANSMDIDDQGNLFVLDRTKYKVFKYDIAGKFQKSFGGHGPGPGEFIQPGTINIRKDTLYITDFNGFKILKLNLEGEYISCKKYEGMTNFPFSPSKFGENYITFGATKNIVTDGKKMTSKDTSLYDRNFNFIKNLVTIEYEPAANEVAFDPSENGLLAAASEIDAYVYESSKTTYKIDVYDKKGDKVREIRRKYMRVKTTEDQLQKIQEMWEKYGRKIKQEYKNSIYSLRADKKNRLWVGSPLAENEEGIHFDVFENDIFINRIKLELDKDYTLNFVGDKIVGVNYDENKIKIYEY